MNIDGSTEYAYTTENLDINFFLILLLYSHLLSFLGKTAVEYWPNYKNLVRRAIFFVPSTILIILDQYPKRYEKNI